MAKNVSKDALYFYRYKAKGADEGTLHRYDRAPLVLFLDFGTKIALGVNIHWIPAGERRKFLDDVMALSKKVKNRRILVKLYYQMVKNNPILKKPALRAIRSYYYNRMSSIQRLPIEQWGIVLGPKYRSRKVTRAKGFRQ